MDREKLVGQLKLAQAVIDEVYPDLSGDVMMAADEKAARQMTRLNMVLLVFQRVGDARIGPICNTCTSHTTCARCGESLVQTRPVRGPTPLWKAPTSDPLPDLETTTVECPTCQYAFTTMVKDPISACPNCDRTFFRGASDL